MNEEKLFHLQIPKNLGIKYAVMPGDPARVEKIAEYMEKPELIAFNREFKSIAGEINGEPVIVTSTGIGGPSAAIALEELYISGVRTAIRIGTCGGISEEVIPGDVIIPTAAVRMEGTSKEYAPLEFPAAADFSVLLALKNSAEKLGCNTHIGIVQSKDSFYGQHSPESMPIFYELENKWESWKRLGVLASEMETAALFTVGHVRGIKTGCILHALWNQERAAKGFKDPDSFDLDITILAAVSALKSLSDGDR